MEHRGAPPKFKAFDKARPDAERSSRMYIERSCIPLNPQRFYDLEHEFRQVSGMIARAVNSAKRAALTQHRKEIVAEARKIVNKLNLPESRWCDAA
jgi:hypothetical protein